MSEAAEVLTMDDVRFSLYGDPPQFEAESGPPARGTPSGLPPGPRTGPAGSDGLTAVPPADLVRGPVRPSFRPLDDLHAPLGPTADPSPEPASPRRLTSCIPNSPLPECFSLSEHQIGPFLVLVVFFLLLGLGHVHLRFTVEELRTQHGQLQKLRRALERQVAGLERERAVEQNRAQVMAALKRGPRSYVEVEPAWTTTAVLPETLRRKYLDSGATEAAMATAARREKENAGRLADLMRLLEAGKAYAAGL